MKKNNPNYQQALRRKLKRVVCVRCEVCPNFQKCPFINIEGLKAVLPTDHRPLIAISKGKGDKAKWDAKFCTSGAGYTRLPLGSLSTKTILN
jgi:hypothetical protein